MTVIWNGAYDSFDDIKEKITEYPNVYDGNHNIHDEAYTMRKSGRWKLLEDNLEPSTENKVLEFGGDVGYCFLAHEKDYHLDYHIIETTICAKQGSFLIPEKINWYDYVPELNNVDILYCRESLQYVEDWKFTISELINNCSPSKIIWEHIPLGDMKTFYTIQHFCDNKLPWCFINFEEFNTHLQKNGYKLTHKRNEPYNYLKRFQNIPTEYRMDGVLDLVYERE